MCNMKRLFYTIAMAAFLLPTAMQAQADPIGSFVRGVANLMSGGQRSGRVYVDMDPALSREAQIMEVSAVGNPATAEVLVSISVTLPYHDAKLAIGGDRTDFATSGRGYRSKVTPRDNRSSGAKELVRGIPYHFQYVLAEVPEGVPSIEVLQLGFSYRDRDRYFNTSSSSVHPIQIRNIPVSWVPVPQVNTVCETYHADDIFQLGVISCVGDRATGSVVLTLAATTQSTKVSLSLGSSCYIEAYTPDGTKFDGKDYVRGSCTRELNPDVPHNYSFEFQNVPRKLQSLHLVRIKYYATDYTNDRRTSDSWYDPIKIMNIPIEWR